MFISTEFLGGAIVRMIQHILGEKEFRKRISNYIESHKYSNAKQDDLWRCLGNVTIQKKKTSISQVMSPWTLQRGYPVVTVSRFDHNGTVLQNISLKQEIFVLDRSKEAKKNASSKWYIPITYTTSKGNFSDTEPKEWLRPDLNETIISKIPEDKALIVNVQHTGFYRVNYDAHNWKLIEDALKQPNFSGIHPMNRAQILFDSTHLAEAGYLDYSVALNLSTFLANETEYMTWRSAIIALSAIPKILKFTNNTEHFSNYLVKQMKPVYDSLDSEPKENESASTLLLRELAVNIICSSGDENCVKMGKVDIEKNGIRTKIWNRIIYSCFYFSIKSL